ncbi:MAG: hypothetical protein ISQ09_03510 [Rubripirellula sp.]|jgi:hypothetical protein|nr:hypothetical protein [Rubripirellula sp.]
MGFLKRILQSNLKGQESSRPARGSFETLSRDELNTHMNIRTYGAFDLTDAVRPSYDLQVVPKQGFRFDQHVDDTTGLKTPAIMASVTQHRLLDLFFELIDRLGPVVDVVLESSHRVQSTHQELYREHIDAAVLKSVLLEFEDLLLNDGCTGIAVINPQKRQEVQLDEHKLIIMYGRPLDEFVATLIEEDVYPDKNIRFITEAEHVHSSSEKMHHRFEILKNRLGIN